ncbi:DUF1622 domain-containing protein [Candidatus Contubernalis alkaliaceticus]|uniref:DUF1622 domain-containing protein n=1 Tax=Candidatus Contubernalis alkaliaceticus TaxID=338645 RepID=UPI001F4C0F67|nr:DUF1622 domain-containing protein [Candidatus Contubernalis alkalaceticus]UNC91544.1 DUF1622 domain-containing protein [Candidatus Contubernalis alkalaceticus]
MEHLEHLFVIYIEPFILFLAHLLDLFGAFVIVISASIVFIQFLKTSKGGRRIRLTLAASLAFGLEFKLGGEILRTVIVRSMDEIIILGAIIILRGLLNLILHWEIKCDAEGLK